MSKIEKDFGKGSIMRMGDEKIENVEVIPTGSLGLDVAMGVGGYPKGRIIEIYGPESSGKNDAGYNMLLLRRRNREVLLLSLMPSMLLTVSMLRIGRRCG